MTGVLLLVVKFLNSVGNALYIISVHTLLIVFCPFLVTCDQRIPGMCSCNLSHMTVLLRTWHLLCEDNVDHT